MSNSPNYFPKGLIGAKPKFTPDNKGFWLNGPKGESQFISHAGKGPIKGTFWKGDTLVVQYDNMDMHMVGCQKGFEDYTKTGSIHDANGYEKSLQEAREARLREDETYNHNKKKDSDTSSNHKKKSSIPVKILKGIWWCVKKFLMLMLFFAVSDSGNKK